MTQNDILRRLRYALQINDSQVAEAIALTGADVGTEQVINWLKREEDEGYVDLSDEMLCRFLDGLIIEKRGPRSDGSTPAPLQFLSNNEVLKKLRIALELRDDDMNAVFELADFVVTKAELLSLIHI